MRDKKSCDQSAKTIVKFKKQNSYQKTHLKIKVHFLFNGIQTQQLADIYHDFAIFNNMLNEAKQTAIANSMLFVSDKGVTLKE